MKKHIGQTGLFITLFIGVVIGVIAISAIYTQITTQTSTSTVTDDQFTMDNTSCVDLTTNCILSLTSIENATGTEVIGAGNYSICRVNAPQSRYDGVLVSADASIDRYNGQTMNSTYVGSDCSYISGGTARNLISYIPLLIIVALLVMVIAVSGLSKT